MQKKKRIKASQLLRPVIFFQNIPKFSEKKNSKTMHPTEKNPMNKNLFFTSYIYVPNFRALYRSNTIFFHQNRFGPLNNT